MSFFQSSSFNSEPPFAGPASLVWLQDVPCHVEFVVAHAQLRLRECMHLAPDVVIRLDRPAGADIELRVEGRAVASGEIVVVDNVASLRVTHIVPQVGADEAPADG